MGAELRELVRSDSFRSDVPEHAFAQTSELVRGLPVDGDGDMLGTIDISHESDAVIARIDNGEDHAAWRGANDRNAMVIASSSTSTSATATYRSSFTYLTSTTIALSW